MATPVELVGNQYKAVAASQTAAGLGTSGSTVAGDVLEGVLIVPATTSPGAVAILDGTTSISVFAGGAGSVSNLVPFFVPLGGIKSANGQWKATTGANVSIIGVGRFA
jgi:hypothetical protein